MRKYRLVYYLLYLILNYFFYTAYFNDFIIFKYFSIRADTYFYYNIFFLILLILVLFQKLKPIIIISILVLPISYIFSIYSSSFIVKLIFGINYSFKSFIDYLLISFVISSIVFVEFAYFFLKKYNMKC